MITAHVNRDTKEERERESCESLGGECSWGRTEHTQKSGGGRCVRTSVPTAEWVRGRAGAEACGEVRLG